MGTGKLRSELLHEQLTSLLGYVRNVGGDLNAQDWLSIAQATCLLVEAERLEQGLPGEVSVVRSATSIDDGLAMLIEENQEAEGA